MAPLLQANGLSFGYDSPIIRGIDLEVFRGECWALLGSNGAGKSTLLSLLGGLATPQEGSVLLDGSPLSSLSPKQRARRVGILPQGIPWAEGYLVYEIVLMGLYATMPARGWEGFSEWRGIARALGRVGAKSLIRRRFGELSGGEQRRVLLARALVSEPDLLLLDEPLASFDPGFTLEMTELFGRVKRRGTALVIATHNLDLAWRLADGVLLLRRGHPAAAGKPGELLTAEKLNSTYGTSAFGEHDRGGGRLPSVSMGGSG